MENNVLLPELVEIGKVIPPNKRNEIQTVLNNVFSGVSKMKTQLDAVVVEDEEDKINMKLANTIRLGVKKARLEAEKVFDAKRDEIKQLTLIFKTEDQLWLKAKQTTQILTKEIEEEARWKEETKKRADEKRKEEVLEQRRVRISKLYPDTDFFEYKKLTDEEFDIFYSTLEKKYNAEQEELRKEEEAKLEKERINNLHIKRKDSILDLWKYLDLKTKTDNLGLYSDKEFDTVLKKATKAKEEEEALNKKREEETEKLRKEAEAREKLIIKERLEALNKQKEENELKRRLQEKIKEALLIREKEEALVKQAEANKKKAENAPDKIKLVALANQIKDTQLPSVKGKKAQAVVNDVSVLLGKVVTHILKHTESL